MKFIALNNDATLPTRATVASAGYDLYASEDVVIPADSVKIVPTGITFEGMKTNEFLQVALRSSISIKTPLSMANGVGIIDSDYAGNPIGIILRNNSEDNYLIRKGDKLAQAILMTYGTVDDEQAPTTVRTGGYGSTGGN